MDKSENIIEIKNLVKDFGKFRALNKLNLEVKKGEVHGFLGPNGSGKSTTIRILLGLIQKTSGQVSILGKEPWGNSVELHKRLTYVPGDVNLWPNLSGGEAIDLLGDLRGGINEAKRKELLAKFSLDPKKKFRTYSKGNRQKVALIAALASDVEVYILDEPTSGLDPLLEVVFQDYIKQLKDEGKTVLLSSHILAEVESLCDRVTIIREGVTVESGQLHNIQKLHRTKFIVEASKPANSLSKIHGVHNFKTNDKNISFDVEPSSLNRVMTKLADLDITQITSHPPQLEELFLQYYQEKDKSGTK